MKKSAGRLNFLFIRVFAGLAVIAIAFSGFLFHRNQLYLDSNRQLVLQNDSIISVNIELRKALQHSATMTDILSVSDTYKSRNSK